MRSSYTSMEKSLPGSLQRPTTPRTTEGGLLVTGGDSVILMTEGVVHSGPRELASIIFYIGIGRVALVLHCLEGGRRIATANTKL